MTVATQTTGRWVIDEVLNVMSVYDGTWVDDHETDGGGELEISFPDVDTASSFVSLLRDPGQARISGTVSSFGEPVTIRLPYTEWDSLFPKFIIND